MEEPPNVTFERIEIRTQLAVPFVLREIGPTSATPFSLSDSDSGGGVGTSGFGSASLDADISAVTPFGWRVDLAASSSASLSGTSEADGTASARINIDFTAVSPVWCYAGGEVSFGGTSPRQGETNVVLDNTSTFGVELFTSCSQGSGPACSDGDEFYGLIVGGYRFQAAAQSASQARRVGPENQSSQASTRAEVILSTEPLDPEVLLDEDRIGVLPGGEVIAKVTPIIVGQPLYRWEILDAAAGSFRPLIAGELLPDLGTVEGVDTPVLRIDTTAIAPDVPTGEAVVRLFASSITGFVTSAPITLLGTTATDINIDGVTSTPDIVLFIDRIVTGDPRADLDESGAADAFDLLDYLNAFQAAVFQGA